ncbi:MAG: hypothetical protein U0228_04800 [Myxococcaceae bacterium]
MRRVLAGLLLLASGSACHPQVRGAFAESLVGFEGPLRPSPAVRVVLTGAVDQREAEVTLDPASPVTFVTKTCLGRPDVRAHVKVEDPFGPDETFPVARVEQFSLGGLRLAPFEAAIAGGDKCVVVLGSSELKGVAIELDPATRRVRFRPSQPREQWLAEAEASGDDAQVLTVTKEPVNDWPLVPVRVRQGAATFQGPVLLSLRDTRSRLYDSSAREAGLRPGLELLDGLPIPAGLDLPPELAQLRGFAFDAFELAPGFGVERGIVDLEPGAPPHVPQGMLGADVWGRFHLVFDLDTGVLVLRRPRVFTSGGRAQCAREGKTSEEACVELHATTFEGGLEVTATMWSPLERGAQLSLDVTGTANSCAIGMTFSSGDRGRSTQHRFPWGRLAESVPGCADAFKGATGVTPGLLEDGTLRECPGVCAWVRDPVRQRLTCECQPGAQRLDGETEKKLLELLKKALEEQLKGKREEEPKDPD